MVIDCEGNGYAAEGGDCDDNDATAYPGADEVPNDGIDQDCDGEDLIKDVKDVDTGPADTGTEDTGGEASDTGDGSKNDASCAVVSGMFGMGALWLGMMGILRRREGEE